jgi:two-component system phosphate regulon sensor histidine kinase PhoR
VAGGDPGTGSGRFAAKSSLIGMTDVLIILAILLLAGGWVWTWRERQALQRRCVALEDEVQRLRKEQSDSMAQSAVERAALLNSMTEGVLVLDSAGRVVLANPALIRQFEVRSPIVGQSILQALRLHQLQEIVERALEQGQVIDAEVQFPGLEERCLQVNATTLVNRVGKREGLLLVFHDLTQLKRLESTRKEFVANVSHELRTPLSMIKGYVETLLQGAHEDPSVRVRFLQTVGRHADRLTYLIEDLLTLSRLDSGQILLNRQPTELAPIAADVLADMRDRAASSRVELHHEVPAGLWVEVDGDRIRQVLVNLVDNAIKYGREGGQVWLRAREAGSGWAEISVQDDGPGIPPDALGRLFDRFFRVDRGRSRDQGGTGLGLAIVKHIVQAHQGEVRVASEHGHGATFTFTLPVARQRGGV